MQALKVYIHAVVTGTGLLTRGPAGRALHSCPAHCDCALACLLLKRSRLHGQAMAAMP